MRLQFPDGRVMYAGRRPHGGIALQQGTSRILLSPSELPIFLDAIDQLMTNDPEPTKEHHEHV
ncbi:hypothetical protein TUM20983_27760 [Mycobacterium antarcticum]|uniref:hypothetical protein n=1 Tax=unclassified Mycolicibacterium TaxID=2636767 RepID=UPI0023A2E91F|nr:MULTISPECIES: hypothetical protein [unclassified Mycolicibacterium]GLP75666.1 hypothetical protein TUM20983_27760 [Mycolicibacterium sp. TUM20983]GLP83983.1 hypothetical protein TUM20984_54030 [Mycolicibacterium sp. TUM20984]